MENNNIEENTTEGKTIEFLYQVQFDTIKPLPFGFRSKIQLEPYDILLKEIVPYAQLKEVSLKFVHEHGVIIEYEVVEVSKSRVTKGPSTYEIPLLDFQS